jgi:PAS domain S-box-containing protein
MDDALKTAPAGYVSFADDGTILRTNDRLLQRLGYADASEIEGKHLEKILSVGGRIFYHTHFFPLLKMQGRIDEIYLSLKAKNGDEVPVLMNGIRLERDGRTVNDCIFMHMQQRHLYEDEILRARREAEAANAAKARFLSMMSHDLRTPLTAITGFAEAMLMGMEGPITDEQREDLADIRKAANQMMTLINDILSFSQLESGRVEVRPERVVVAEALARSEALVQKQITERSLAYERAGCDGDIAVLADPNRLQQVILNLLTNAMKFTPAGGKITVTCERQDGNVLIHVADTGIGIPPERLRDIFEPFVQVSDARADTSGQGVGLGLSISRDLARAMGGNLTVESRPGEGSTFTVTLLAAV